MPPQTFRELMKDYWQHIKEEAPKELSKLVRSVNFAFYVMGWIVFIWSLYILFGGSMP